jgi:putative iron-regulated protein
MKVIFSSSRFMHRLPPTLLLLSLVACGADEDPKAAFPTAKAELALADYKTLVNANYTDVVTSAQALQAAIDAFIAAPSAATQDAAKNAWLAARLPYGPSEAFRFYGGPIDDPMTGPEGQLNAWPLDENYIDYARDEPNSGIINRVADVPAITVDVIAKANEAAGEKAIATGYHAIEFLLWGQDDATPGMGAGKRPFTDYVVGGTAENQSRRADYLKAATQLLVSDLQEVATAWKPGVPDNFRAKFGVTASEGNALQTAIGDMLKSLGSLAKAELAGERMTVAYKSKDQEDEHSCFSDNTSVDLLSTGTGIQNVWLGRYGENDGVGLDEVVAEKDAALSSKTTADIAAAVAKLQVLADLQKANTPLDVIISSPDGSPSRVAMLDAITALKLIGDDVEHIAVALGLTIELEKPSTLP